jgi:hypothetical protein
MEPLKGTFHNAQTGETIVRELTAEEIADLPQWEPDDLES